MKTLCFFHVTYAFQSEYTLYSCHNVEELLARNKRDIWNINNCNGTRNHNHLVCKQTLSHLTKLAVVSFRHLTKQPNWLSVPLQTKWLWVRILLQSNKIKNKLSLIIDFNFKGRNKNFIKLSTNNTHSGVRKNAECYWELQ